MSSISSAMHAALSALQTQQILINVANSNIANANTDGYSRLTAVTSATNTSSSSATYTGTGVEVTGVNRVTDSFTLKQLCSANADAGELSAELEYLEGIETVFDESEGSGLSDALSEFFSAWSDLANDPTGSTVRSVLLSDAESLVSTLQDMFGDLQDIQSSIIDDISQTTDDINDITGQIADLNQKILEGNAGGIDTSTYEDERDSLLTELSSKVGIAYYEDDSGQVNVQLSNGASLVIGSNALEMTATSSTITLNGDDVTDSISGGELGGEQDSLETVQGYMADLDAFAVALADAVNAIHTTGVDADGTTGGNFFTYDSTDPGVSTLSVNISDINDIAAASSSDSSAIAIAVAELQDTSVTFTKTISGVTTTSTNTFEEYYSSLVSKIGTEVENTTSSSETQSDLVTYYENYRESVSGVSTDEELANIVLYQNAYEAAAKVMSVLDELLETMINI